MSIAAKIKEFEDLNKAQGEQLAALTAKIETITAEHKAAIDTLTAAHTSAIAEVNTKNAELTAKVATIETEKTDLKAIAETMCQERDAARALVAKREKQLADPAFADAAAPGNAAVQAGDGGGSDLWTEYLAIKDQKARAEFYNAHRAELDKTAAAHGGLK